MRKEEGVLKTILPNKKSQHLLVTQLAFTCVCDEKVFKLIKGMMHNSFKVLASWLCLY